MIGGVFISYASHDVAAASALVAALEAAGVGCWIAARDVPPGGNYQAEIAGAIRAARGVVLLFSEAANGSAEVLKELSLASAAGVAVYPVRMGAAAPGAAMAYELATRQWVAWGEPAEVAGRIVAALGGGERPALALPDKPSIAVLPFVNLSGDAEQAYFADGVAEDVLAELSRDRRLFVIVRGSSFAYRGQSVDVRQVSRELGVRYVLDGSVRRAGARLRVSARLNDAPGGAVVWTERYDRSLDDLFAVQDEITAAVSEAVGVALSEAEQGRALRVPPADLTAWEAYQRGLWHLGHRTAEAVETAIGFFRQAHARDPQFLPALVSWAGAIRSQRVIYMSRAAEEAAAEQLSVARAALAIDPRCIEAVLLVGEAEFMLGGSLEAIDRAISRADTLRADTPAGLYRRGSLKVFRGRATEGRQEILQALRLDPRNPELGQATHVVAVSYCIDGDYAAALTQVQHCIAAGPPTGWKFLTLAVALAELGRQAEARAALDKGRAMMPHAFVRAGGPVVLMAGPRVREVMLAGLRKAGWEG